MGPGLMIAQVHLFPGLPMHSILLVLAQMDQKYLLNDGTPQLTVEYSYGFTWVIAALVTAGILLVTFKTSKRNRLERE
jgi:hypothetical protein